MSTRRTCPRISPLSFSYFSYLLFSSFEYCHPVFSCLGCCFAPLQPPISVSGDFPLTNGPPGVCGLVWVTTGAVREVESPVQDLRGRSNFPTCGLPLSTKRVLCVDMQQRGGKLWAYCDFRTQGTNTFKYSLRAKPCLWGGGSPVVFVCSSASPRGVGVSFLFHRQEG